MSDLAPLGAPRLGPPSDEELASMRGYLLYIAEQHLEADLRAKGGASDLVQTALLAAQRTQGQFRGTSPEDRRGWLRGVLLNVLARFRRRWRCRCRAVGLEVPLDDQVSLRRKGPGPETPSAPARRREDHEELTLALGRLSPEERHVIARHLEGGQPFAEIGRSLGKSPDAVRMLYHRALKRLQAQLPARGD